MLYAQVKGRKKDLYAAADIVYRRGPRVIYKPRNNAYIIHNM